MDKFKTNYLFCHGFGFSDDYWDGFVQLLEHFSGEDNCSCEFFDAKFTPDKNTEYIGIGHSVGFLKLNNFKRQNPKMRMKALVGLQGFLDFCGSDPAKRKTRIENLDKMIRVFGKNPENALRFFWRACGYPTEGTAIPTNLSKNELIADLELMKCSFAHCSVPTLIIGSFEDTIVEPCVLFDNFCSSYLKEAQNILQLSVINGVNHTLGFSKPTETLGIIQTFLKTLI